MLLRRSNYSKLSSQCFGTYASYITMTTRASHHTQRFAPLDPTRSSGSDAPRLKGIVFDVDGTLWYVLDFVLILRSSSLGNLYFGTGIHAAKIVLDCFCPSIVHYHASIYINFPLISQINVTTLSVSQSTPDTSIFVVLVLQISYKVPNVSSSTLANPNHTCSKR